MPETRSWNILELIKVTENLLKEKNIDNARLNSELLLADTLKTKRINLYLDFEKPLNQTELSDFREKVRRRLNHEPLQYILGYCEFYGLKFRVMPGVLIPRQETEILVEKSIEQIKTGANANPRVLEIGTGSGCISISIAKNTDCKIDAIDADEKAVTIARENAESNGVQDRIKFIKKDISSEILNFDGYDLVISNPPYIPMNEFSSLPEEIRDYEPKSALTDGSDGLVFYRKIFEILKSTGNPVKVLLEIGDGKSRIIKELMDENGIKNYSFYKDLMNIDRVVLIEHKPT